MFSIYHSQAVNSVTRFGEILSFWQNFKSAWVINKGIYLVLGNILIWLLYSWVYFSFFKWPKIEQTIWSHWSTLTSLWLFVTYSHSSFFSAVLSFHSFYHCLLLTGKYYLGRKGYIYFGRQPKQIFQRYFYSNTEWQNKKD